jgi:hypothetical protein
MASGSLGLQKGATIGVIASNPATSVVVYQYNPDTFGSAHGGSVR